MDTLQGGMLSLEHQYRVQTPVGRHAFARRYQATLSPFDDPVWLHLYTPLEEVGAGPTIYRRIKQSARRAHRLKHEGILRLLDYGDIDNGVPFVITERTTGPTLQDLLDDEGTLTPRRTARLVRRLADILEPAHREGLPHGTLDPVWIQLPGGEMDRAGIDRFQVGLTLDELRRISGAVLTPDAVRAFPPETFARDTAPADAEHEARDSDPTESFSPAADIYALGTIAYRALTGVHPFFDDEDPTDASEGIMRIQNEEPPKLSEFGIDAEIDDAVQRALNRRPERRWESAADFADALDRAVSGTSASAPTSEDAPPPAQPPGDAPDSIEPSSAEDTKPGPASTLVTVAILAFVITNIAWFVWYLTPSTTPPSPSTVQVRSEPTGATVYRRGRSEPLGTTPLQLKPSNDRAIPLHLKLTKPGFADSRITFEIADGPRFSVELTPEGNSQE